MFKIELSSGATVEYEQETNNVVFQQESPFDDSVFEMKDLDIPQVVEFLNKIQKHVNNP